PAVRARLLTQSDTAARAEAGPGRQRAGGADAFWQEVRGSEAHRRLAHHPLPFEFAVPDQHSQEAVVIARAADEPGAAERERRRTEVDRGTRGIERQRPAVEQAVVRRQAADLARRHLEPGARHSERVEQPLLQESVEGP